MACTYSLMHPGAGDDLPLLESRQLHDPIAARGQGRGGAIGAHGIDNLVLCDVAIACGDNTRSEPRPRPGGYSGHGVTGEEELVGEGDIRWPAARSGASSACASRHIEGVHTAVL